MAHLTGMDYSRGNLENYLCNRTATIASGFPVTEAGIRQNRPYFLMWVLFLKDFFQYLGHSDYEYIVSPDKTWEVIHPNGTWGGVIGMVKNEEVDIGMSSGISYKRMNVIDFAVPLDINTFLIITKEKVVHTNNTYFLSVYSPFAFLCIFTTLFAVTILSLLFDTLRINQNRARLSLVGLAGNTLWRSLRMLFGETSSMRSGVRSVNVLILTWLLALVVFDSCYENFISAEFTIPNKEKTIDSGEDLLDAVSKGKMTWGTYANTALEIMLQTAKDGVLHKLWQVSAPHWSGWREAFASDPYSRVINQNYAFVSMKGEIVVASYNRTGQYHLSTSGLLFIMGSYAISKSSPFRKVINFYVLSAREFGFLKKWETEVEVAARRFEDPNQIMSHTQQLELKIVKHVFFFGLAGLFLSCVVFIIEVLTARRLKKQDFNLGSNRSCEVNTDQQRNQLQQELRPIIYY